MEAAGRVLYPGNNNNNNRPPALLLQQRLTVFA
jgi:hypothetical protein